MIRFYMKPTKDTPQIPKNYFCHFKYHIKDKEIYKIDITRYNSSRYNFREKIDMKVTMTPLEDKSLNLPTQPKVDLV